MGNTGEDTVKRSTQTMGSTIVAILLGGTIGLVALLLLTLLTAALVWPYGRCRSDSEDSRLIPGIFQ